MRVKPVTVFIAFVGVLACLCSPVLAAPPTYTISGVVATADGTDVEGVDVAGDNGATSAVTAADGSYSITVSNHWDGTVTVSKTGWLITPPSNTYTNVSASITGENYTAYQPIISGYVRNAGGTPLEGATVTADNSGGTDTTDASGYYEIAVPYNWTGAVSATLAEYHFTDKNYTNIIADQANQDFSGYQPTISGYVKKSDSAPLEGATINADNGGGSGATDVNGYYEIIVPYDWSGQVSANKIKWNIAPESYSYANVISDQTDQDFSATYISPIIVKADGTGYVSTIQAAVDIAEDGDIVQVEDGTYTGNGNRDIFFRGKAITVRGNVANPSLVVIDCQGTNSVPHRGFKFVNGEEEDSILEGLTITNGYASGTDLFPLSGGAIYCESSGPTIQNAIFSFNTASGGGGAIWNDSDCTTKISNCYFFNNQANGSGGDRGGGAIWNYYSQPLIVNCNFVENNAPNGGAIKNYKSSPELIECYFQENHAGSDGGAINNYINSHSDIKNSFFINNRSNMRGGAVCNYYSSPTFSNCIFKGNNSISYTNSFAGAIRNSESSPHFTHCTFYGNRASSGGDGFSNSNSSYPIITNSILWDWPRPIYNVSIPELTDSRAIVTFSNVYGGYAGIGNISINPLFKDPTNINFHLKSEFGRWDSDAQMWVNDDVTSPCIDAGDPNDTGWQNELWPHGGRINMGAYGGTPQASMSLNDVGNPADLNHDDAVDLIDWSLWADDWGDERILLDSDFDLNSIVDANDMGIFMNSWLWFE